ncbi:MAG: hypothetical protein HQK51_10185 [Oligoflexia bacterium]|nr:hypothetical protein [Oligoflexia bacterium]
MLRKILIMSFTCFVLTGLASVYAKNDSTKEEKINVSDSYFTKVYDLKVPAEMKADESGNLYYACLPLSAIGTEVRAVIHFNFTLNGNAFPERDALQLILSATDSAGSEERINYVNTAGVKQGQFVPYDTLTLRYANPKAKKCLRFALPELGDRNEFSSIKIDKIEMHVSNRK